jgi:DNA-binding NarL/FixJ family response regulator
MDTSRSFALVAEDTELGRWAIAHALQAAGFEVHLSGGWVESAGWLDRVDFDVAVMALACDRDDVAHITSHLRREHARTRLVVLALQDDSSSIRQVAGPDVIVLEKPLNVEQVVLAAKSFTQPGVVAKGA